MCVKMLRFLQQKKDWGEDMIIDSPELVDHAQAVALTYVEVFTLRRKAFYTLLKEYAEPRQVVRLRPSCLRVIDLLTARRQGRAMRSSVGVPRAARGGIFSGSGASAAACWLYSSHSDCGGALVCGAPCRMWAS